MKRYYYLPIIIIIVALCSLFYLTYIHEQSCRVYVDSGFSARNTAGDIYSLGVAVTVHDLMTGDILDNSTDLIPYLPSLLELSYKESIRGEGFVVKYNADNGIDYGSSCSRTRNILVAGRKHILTKYPYMHESDNIIYAYICGDDYEPLLGTIMGTYGMAWPGIDTIIIPQESGGSLFNGNVAPALHEMMHILLNNKKAGLPYEGRDRLRAYDRLHMLIYYYSQYLELSLFPNEDRMVEWMFIDLSKCVDNITFTEVQTQLEKEWCMSNYVESKESKYVYDAAFMYMLSKYGEDIVGRLMEDIYEDDYPWNVLQRTATDFTSDMTSYYARSPETVGYYINVIDDADGNASSDVYKRTLAVDKSYYTAISIGLAYIHLIDCEYEGMSKLSCETRESVRGMILINVAEYVEVMGKHWRLYERNKKYVEMLAINPRKVEYTKDSIWGKDAMDLCSENIIERVKHYAGPNQLYKELIVEMGRKRPMLLKNLTECYMYSDNEEQRAEYALRILSHPSVIYCQAVYEMVKNKCPGIEKYVSIASKPNEVYLMKAK